MDDKGMRWNRVRAVASVPALVLLVAVSGAARAAKVPGTVEGSINGDPISVNGVCSLGDNSFEFWSDGTRFAVSRDSNGDGVYLNISVTKLGENTFNALWYGRGGEVVYKGQFDYAERDERSMSVNTKMGRADMPARFEVQCSG